MLTLNNYFLRKHHFFTLLALLFVTACSKDNAEFTLQTPLEQRGNDNHKIWKLSHIENLWEYTLSNGFRSTGNQNVIYIYGCSRPVGRAISCTDVLIENGITFWDNAHTFSYNDNFKIETEHPLH
ncbi:MAG: hypothetical protein SH818_01085 [Saprospiraceae bacterium]|nr:hypothetical protein [Saprospiraceae bacterium]